MRALGVFAVFVASASVGALDSGGAREVRANTIISRRLPAARFRVDSRMRYVGSQVVDLYGKAEAEQYVFVEAGRPGPVSRFCWVQFEHFLPTNELRYESRPAGFTRLGELDFEYDVWAYADYSVSVADPGSDGAAMAGLLASHGFSFPKRVARVRLFHFPTPDRRSEVMVIYGEAVPESSSIPVTGNRISLDRAAPEAARLLLAQARETISASKE
jgi:hypothetical protein